MSVQPFGNVHNPDLPRIEIAQIYLDGNGNRYLVADIRFCRTGTFGAGYYEFYVIKLNPVAGRVNEMWVREKTIQETCLINRNRQP